MERRKFLSVAGTVGLAGLFRLGPKRTATYTDYINPMRKVLQDQARMHDPWDDEQEGNFRYAFSRIQPASHIEYAFIAAVSRKSVPCGCRARSCNDATLSYLDESENRKTFTNSRDLVDEYVRRRSGDAPKFYHHPVFALKTWGTPETRCVLVFMEQIEAVLYEVFGNNEFNILCRRSAYPRSLLIDRAAHFFPGALSLEDLDGIITMLEYYAPRALPYAWCSTMAARAEAIVRSEMG